jgi:hypothetical protein
MENLFLTLLNKMTQRMPFQPCIFPCYSFMHSFDPQRYADDGAEAAQTAKALHQCNLVCGYFGLKSTVEGDGEQSDVEPEET